MEERIRVEDICFRYGKTGSPAVFESLSFTISKGDLVCFLGPNGTGKSTLLKCLNGLLKPEKGSVYLYGKKISTLSRAEIASTTGFVPQSQTSTFPFPVRDVVIMGRTPHLPLFSSPGKKDRQIADEVMEMVGITHLADKPCTMISGGEWQLTLIARALTQEPEILILDEPTSHLDMGNQLKVLKFVQRLTRSGLTVVMASHFPDHAFLGSSRVAVLKDGNIFAMGSPDEVVTEAVLEKTYGVKVKVSYFEEAGRKVCVPVIDK